MEISDFITFCDVRLFHLFIYFRFFSCSRFDVVVPLSSLCQQSYARILLKIKPVNSDRFRHGGLLIFGCLSRYARAFYILAIQTSEISVIFYAVIVFDGNVVVCEASCVYFELIPFLISPGCCCCCRALRILNLRSLRL